MDGNCLKMLVKLTQEGQLSSLERLMTSDRSEENITSQHFGRSGDTLLHYAARHGHLDVVEFLIKQLGMDVEVCNNDYKRPLHEAASLSHQACVSYLLHAGAKVDSLKKADCSQITDPYIQWLCSRCGYTPDNTDSCGVTPFMDAARNGHISVARMLLEKHQASPTAADRLGAQTLHQVAVTGQEEALYFLVRDLKVDVNQKVTGVQLTALHYAAKEGHTSTVKTLLELGADLHVRDKRGRSVLHMACIGQHADVVRTLLQIGLKDSGDTSGIRAQQLARKPDVVRAFECSIQDAP